MPYIQHMLFKYTHLCINLFTLITITNVDSLCKRCTLEKFDNSSALWIDFYLWISEIICYHVEEEYLLLFGDYIHLYFTKWRNIKAYRTFNRGSFLIEWTDLIDGMRFIHFPLRFCHFTSFVLRYIIPS